MAERRVGVLGPDRGGETEGTVVHELDRLLVRLHLHEAGDRAEDLLAHDRHRVIDVEQHLRREVRRAGAARRKLRLRRSPACAPAAIDAATCARIASAAAVRTTGPSVVAARADCRARTCA